MNDKLNKVIQGLECCSRSKDKDICDQCPYFSSCGTEYGSFSELAYDALELIRDVTLSKIKAEAMDFQKHAETDELYDKALKAILDYKEE